MEERYAQQFKKGALEMILLELLAEGESYGYALITSLNQRGGPVFDGSKEGTVYPILYRLEKAGLVESRLAPSGSGGSRKYYALTETGRRNLSDMTAFWGEYRRCVEKFLLPKEEMTWTENSIPER